MSENREAINEIKFEIMKLLDAMVPGYEGTTYDIAQLLEKLIDEKLKEIK